MNAPASRRGTGADSGYYSRFDLPLARPGIEPRYPQDARASWPAKLWGNSRRRRKRRLAIIDTHFPWPLSGFRLHEFDAMARADPSALFFSLNEMAPSFRRRVHALHDFPARAEASGVTDVYMVFLNFAAGVLGMADHPLAAQCPGVDPNLNLAPAIRRLGLRVHVTLYPGGGLTEDTPDGFIAEAARRCQSVFTNVERVMSVVPDAIYSQALTSTVFYSGDRHVEHNGPLRLVFAAENRPRKGLRTLIEAFNGLDPDAFSLDIVGPHEEHVSSLANPSFRCHGWLSPEELRDLYLKSDVFVSPVTRDSDHGSAGEAGMIDGFPTSCATDALAAGCCLVSSNPTGASRILREGSDFLLIPEDDPSALRAALLRLQQDPDLRGRLATTGQDTVRRRMDVTVGAREKLEHMLHD